MTLQKFLLRGLAVVGLIIFLVWPAIYNTEPFYFPDTRNYIRAADDAINKLAKVSTAWTRVDDDLPANTSTGTVAAQPAAQRQNTPAHPLMLQETGKKGIRAGRSIYYGLTLYLGWVTSRFWISVFLQAGAVLLALCLALRGLKLPVWPNLLHLGIGLGLLSDLPFFTSFLMPDVYAGIAILGCALLFACADRFGWRQNVLYYLLISFAMLFHDSILAIVFVLLLAALFLNLILKSWSNKKSLAILALALLTAIAGQALFTTMVKRSSGSEPQRLPFLTARLVGTSYGTEYLRATCPGNSFAVCQYLSNFPEYSENFLWGSQGTFAASPLETRWSISLQDVRLARSIFLYAPWRFTEDIGWNSIRQFATFPLSEFQYHQDAELIIPLEAREAYHRSRAYIGTMHIEVFSVLNYCTVILSMAYLLSSYLFAWPRKLADPHMRKIGYWVIAGVVLNALICATLSGVFPRYESRLVWLFPLLVLLVEVHAFLTRKE